MDDWDNILGGLETEKDEYDGEWYCQSCEFGPMTEAMKKCDRCGEKKDTKYAEDEYDADGYPIETNEPEEIY